MIPDDSALNPYESPKVKGTPVLAGEPWLTTYHPYVMPRDALDVVFGATFGVVFGALAYGIPLFVLYLLQAPVVYYGVAIIAVVALALLAMSVGIRTVELTSEGIIARRRFWSSVQIRWSEVRSARIAGRWDSLIASVFLPHRCCSYSLTSRDQICIEAGKSKLLFPAKDPGSFCATVRLLAARSNPEFAS